MLNLSTIPHKIAQKVTRKITNEIEDIKRSYFQKDIWSKIINDREYRIAGLMRTGNHAIINWLRAQAKAKGLVIHLNNLIPDENPYRYKYQMLRDFYPQHKVTIANMKQQASGDLVPRNCLIYSYEDYKLSNVFSDRFEQKHDLYLGKTEKRYDIIIVRDPFNLIASRLKQNMLSVKDFRQNFVDLWIAYAREYVGETNYLKHSKLCINYNQWCDAIDYRREIAERLGLEFSDAGFNFVASHGGGSSFDGEKFQSKGSQMNTKNRWQHYTNDPHYRKLIQNSELLFYARQIFGDSLVAEVCDCFSIPE
jgi:hypothetical protein